MYLPLQPILCIARQGKSVLVKAFYVNASRYSPRGKESLFDTSGGGESPRVCADDATFELYCNRAVNHFRDTFSFKNPNVLETNSGIV